MRRCWLLPLQFSCVARSLPGRVGSQELDGSLSSGGGASAWGFSNLISSHSPECLPSCLTRCHDGLIAEGQDPRGFCEEACAR